MKFNLFKHGSIQRRFLFRVLAPPFMVLLIVSLLGFWQFNRAVRNSATEDLARAASTTAAKLEREFALRKTILTTTGDELFNIKSDYQTQRSTLETQHTKCKNFVRTNSNFVEAPNYVCEPFLPQFAEASVSGKSLTQAAEDGYVELANTLSLDEQTAIKQRLDAFVAFFPETVAMLIIDKEGKLVSQAASTSSGIVAEYDKLLDLAKKSIDTPVEGEVNNADDRQAIFAYAIEYGAALAVYNVDNPSFLYNTWNTTPIDGTKSYAVITDSSAELSYPKLDDQALYQNVIKDSQKRTSVEFKSNGISYFTVSEQAEHGDWQVIVGSPAAIVLSEVRTGQLIAIGVIGGLLVSFLWVGTIFVRRTIQHILILTSGAIIFASNKLDHRIQLQNSSDHEFNQLAETMNNMAERIQAAETAIDQKNKEFISIATHELKAPMTAIIGNLSMILEDGVGAVDEQARNLTNEAYTGTIRLRDLVSELLDIARLESGRAKFELMPLDLRAETQAIINMQKVPAQQKQVSVTHPPSDNLPKVTADRIKLQIILTNFISNAIKYNRSPGVVTVTHALQPDGHVVTTISDTGLGIPKEQQDKMFQKFFRVEADDRKNIPGTGLGMYITKQFIEAMGGKLWFESETGKGTSFHFTLPAVAQTSPTPATNPDMPSTPNQKPTIVVG